MERMRWANEVTPLYSCLACVAGDEKEKNEKGLGREDNDHAKWDSSSFDKI